MKNKEPENVFEAKIQLNEFLKKHPEMVFYQKRIDEVLRKAGSNHNRIVMLNRLIHDNLVDLEKSLLQLKKKLEVFK